MKKISSFPNLQGFKNLVGLKKIPSFYILHSTFLIFFHSTFLVCFSQAQNINAKEKFTNSAEALKQMLQSKKELSVKDAYYTMESAWGNVYCSKEEYNNYIKSSAQFIKAWLSEKNLDTNDQMNLHYGICKFLRDTLYLSLSTHNQQQVAEPVEATTHFPFSYDYIDFKAQNDYRNTFVTKAFATGTGQCSTLPAVYIILAEELKIKAWISYAPYHSFIKFKNNKGVMQNYDPASKLFITDQLYEDYLFISADAEKNRIYLDTLGKQQIIAACLIDLARMYMVKFNCSDLNFVDDCINTALNYFPLHEANIQAWFIKSNLAVNRLYQNMDVYGIKDISKVDSITELKKLKDEYLQIEAKIKELGYRDIPKEQYALLMERYKKKEEEQVSSGIHAKEKRELFLKE